MIGFQEGGDGPHILATSCPDGFLAARIPPETGKSVGRFYTFASVEKYYF